MLCLVVGKPILLLEIAESHIVNPDNLKCYWVFFGEKERKIIISGRNDPFLYLINVTSTLVMKYTAPLDYTLIYRNVK